MCYYKLHIQHVNMPICQQARSLAALSKLQQPIKSTSTAVFRQRQLLAQFSSAPTHSIHRRTAGHKKHGSLCITVTMSNLHRFLAALYVMKRGICYQRVCVSVCPSVCVCNIRKSRHTRFKSQHFLRHICKKNILNIFLFRSRFLSSNKYVNFYLAYI